MLLRTAPLLTALLLTLACDGGKTEAKKDDPKKADAKVADAKTADAKAGDAKAPDAKADDADKEAKEAKEAEERKQRIAKGLVELEEWKAAESTRWTDEVEADAKRLAETDWKDVGEAMTAVLAGKHRHPTNVARDQYRHPAETLAFLGLQPTMTVVEVGPGWGWYTELLAPVLAKQGKLMVTTADPAGPEDQGATLYARRFQTFTDRSPSAYGKIGRIIQKDNNTLDLGPDGSADMVLVIRGMHSWVGRGVFDENVKKIHAALKPGGIAAIVQHRAKDDAKAEESSEKGYLPQPWVVERFEAAGFTLEEASELNANPKDTKDHPEGVWTLPPALTLGDTDKAKYEEIGESDRMTLRFRKP